MNPATLLIAAGCLVLAGCSHGVRREIAVEAKSFRTENVAPATYWLVSQAPSPPGDLRAREAEDLVRSHLQRRGFREAADAGGAEIVVTLDYGISGPHRRLERRIEPTHRAPPRPSSTGRDDGDRPPSTAMGRESDMGEKAVTVLVTYFTKHVTLDARERAGRSAWKTRARLDDADEDLRRNLPLLIATAADHIGTDSEQPLLVEVRTSRGHR